MIDFAPWDQMLRQHVDSAGRVDYRRWQQLAGELSHWLSTLEQINLASLEANHKLALLINLYNARVIEQVMQKYPIDSIRPSWLGIPNWIAFLWFFTKPVHRLESKRVSLNHIEHSILRKLGEPRIHFALVCAAVGCPLLRNQAYCPEQVQAQLAEDAQRFIGNPAKVDYRPAQHQLYCSKIFKWYRSDFLQAAPSIPAYIQRYRSIPKLDTAAVEYLPYDWSLNDQSSTP
ncbi:DUF547 domain-containing protein [Romeria aff. gracilis LEGE 07310]|uniref:DUF547 domain-containing protein n=1 Tax=Vasconcelosia minhoensis LEGE 07310 TaxID=915328 RepID=A0A8J7APF4_9CYAN|nr:DUF547 domain-containing protein [Romeria gracilis]MBE9078885.1 DUF547 domain-containing protein [Romeria aff. gracilis LEGE 07310]